MQNWLAIAKTLAAVEVRPVPFFNGTGLNWSGFINSHRHPMQCDKVKFHKLFLGVEATRSNPHDFLQRAKSQNSHKKIETKERKAIERTMKWLARCYRDISPNDNYLSIKLSVHMMKCLEKID